MQDFGIEIWACSSSATFYFLWLRLVFRCWNQAYHSEDVVLRKVESRMQFLGAGDASSFRIAAKNATLLKDNLQELMNET